MPSPTPRRLEIQDIQGVTVARWDDQPHWPEDGNQLLKLAEDSGPHKILVNFANVDSLQSMVIAKLLSLQKKLQMRGGSLTLCHVSPRVREVFDITRVSELLQFHPTEQEALQTLASRSSSTSA